MPLRLPFLLARAVCTAVVVTATPPQQPVPRDIESVLMAASNLASGTNDTYALRRYQDLLRVSPEMQARLVRFYDTDRATRDLSGGLNPLKIFSKNLAAAEHACHEAGTVENCPLGANPFLDMSREEFAATHLGFKYPSASASLGDNLHGLWRPAHSLRTGSSDWRGRGVLTPVKDQEGCGSCWAFAAVEQIESDYAIASGRLLELSPQQLLATTYGWSGSPHHTAGRDGCNGGFGWDAMAAAFAMGGVLDETTLPYEASATPVDDKVGVVLGKWDKLALRLDPHAALQLRSVTDVVAGANYKAGMIDMLHDGPVLVSVDGTCLKYVNVFFLLRWNEPVTRAHCESLHRFLGSTSRHNHEVQIVAYISETDRFVVRNQWGSGWADDGYVDVQADACLIVSKNVYQTHMPSSQPPSVCSCAWTKTWGCPGSGLGSYTANNDGSFCFYQCCPTAALRDILTDVAKSTPSPGGLLPSPPDSLHYDTNLLVNAFRQADLDKLAEGLVTYFGKVDPMYLSWSNKTEATWLTRLIHRDRREQAIRANHLANSAKQIILSVQPGLFESEQKRFRLTAQLREVALATTDERHESGACDCTWTCPSSSAPPEKQTGIGEALAIATGLGLFGGGVYAITRPSHDEVCDYFCCGPDDATARREAQACIQQRNADAKKYHDSIHGILFYIIIMPIVIVLALIILPFFLVTYPLRAMFDDEADGVILL